VPVISIFTPTLDRPDMLTRAATSVLLQSHEDWEWIVLDVGRIPVGRLLPPDRRIHYFRIGSALGPAADFQRALELTSGEVVHPLSDDDMLTREALEIVSSEMGEHEWLVGKTLIYDDNGEIAMERGGTAESFRKTMEGKYMLGGGVYWRRTLSDRLGGFNPSFSGAADVELYMRFGRDCEPRIIPDVLYLYFDHPGTDSRLNAQRQGRQVQRILDTQ
jgi:glycosyltransferase involved in cell wall biosynthesis